MGPLLAPDRQFGKVMKAWNLGSEVHMRAAIVAAAILLPTALNAQRLPTPVIPRLPLPPEAAVPAPLPPQPAPIAQELAYKRLRLSVETYPVVSFIRSPGYANGGSFPSWWTFGTGSRFDYRLARYMSATLDMTMSYLGGPALVESAEAGTRFARPRDAGRLLPFADLRFGYIAAFTKNLGAYDGIYGGTTGVVSYSHGFGGIAGAGFEYALTRMFSMTTELSAMQGGLTAHAFEAGALSDRHFGLVAYRYTLGLRFNPVRYARSPGEDTR